jgi:NADH:ubiquinone oxidoreductase subunit 2 (subunit N)
MEIEKKNLFKKAFVISLLFTITGAMMKISHWEYSSIFLIIGILSTILYVVVGIYEVNNSNRISSSEKGLWTIGFIAFSFFVGLFYLVSGRKNVA